MRRRSLPFACLACLIAAAPAFADLQAGAQRVRKILGQLKKGNTAGVIIARADGAIVLEHQPDALFKPASVLKLFITAAALERFGPHFQLQTQAYIAGDELVVIGGGDPGLGDERLEKRRGLTAESLWDAWAKQIREMGLTSIGNIVLDDSRFDQQWRHPSWPAAQSAAWYQAPTGALNLNDNCLDSRVLTGPPIRLELRPQLPTDFIDNRLRSGEKHAPRVNRAATSDTFMFSGPVKRSAELGPVAAREPTLFFGHALRAALEKRGAKIQGQVVRRENLRPDGRWRALPAHSTSIEEILWRCNTFSQNLFAECLAKALAAYGPDGQPTGSPGSWVEGLEIAKATLGRLAVNLDGAVWVDGSGLSHDNRVRPSQVAELLHRMRLHPQARMFRDSLARAGEIGSMQRRYNEPRLRGALCGKTGSIDGVSTFGGYLTLDGEDYIVVVLAAGPGASDLPQRICQALAG